VYFHDNWKARKNLTINAGLRWDLDTGLTNSDLQFFFRLAP